MRIAYLTHQYPGIRMGGLGSYTLAAARSLAAGGEHEVHVFTFAMPEDVLRQAPLGVHIHAIPDLAARVAAGTVSAELSAAIQAGGEATFRLAMGVLLGEAVLAAHAQTPFDVVEAPECEGLTVPLMLRLREKRPGEESLAVVTQFHSCAAISRRANQLAEAPGDLAIDAFECATIALADAVCAMTNAVVRETHAALEITRPAELIPLAIPPEGEFTPPPPNAPVLFVGRLERLKGVDVLTKAANIFLGRCPAARLRVVGPDTPTAPVPVGEEKSMRAWMLRQLDPAVAPRVEFTGELPPLEVAREMRQSAFLALPSVVENFSLVAAQAMAIGRTAIFTEEIGTAEVYGPAGVSFRRNDSSNLAAQMEQLWNDHARLDALSRAAWRRARDEFNPQAITARQIAFYQKAIRLAADRRPEGAVLPPRFGAALLGPLLAMTRFACGLRNAEPQTPGARLLALMQSLAERQGHPVRVLLYGAGRHSARLLTEQHLWASFGHEVAGFIDDHPRWANGGTHLGLPVHSRAELAMRRAADEGIPPIVLSTDTFENQFWEQTAALRAAGITVLRLYGSNA